MRRCLASLLGLGVLLLLAADHAPALYSVRVLRATVELARFAVELADEPEEWRRGLMHRPALPPQGGMLFVFPEAAPRTFWMLNTLIPLDILFADATGRILNIHHHVPPCLPPRRCPTYPSAGAAKYVLEIAGGQARALGIAAGDTLQLDERLEHGTRR